MNTVTKIIFSVVAGFLVLALSKDRSQNVIGKPVLGKIENPILSKPIALPPKGYLSSTSR